LRRHGILVHHLPGYDLTANFKPNGRIETSLSVAIHHPRCRTTWLWTLNHNYPPHGGALVRTRPSMKLIWIRLTGQSNEHGRKGLLYRTVDTSSGRQIDIRVFGSLEHLPNAIFASAELVASGCTCKGRRQLAEDQDTNERTWLASSGLLEPLDSPRSRLFPVYQQQKVDTSLQATNGLLICGTSHSIATTGYMFDSCLASSVRLPWSLCDGATTRTA
jgi:hypothetical protein